MKLFAPLLAAAPLLTAEVLTIEVQPHTTRAIEGISELDRDVYFAIGDGGNNIEQRIRSEKYRQEIFDTYGARLGRLLGPINFFVRWRGGIREDPARPGFVDRQHFIESFAKQPVTDSPVLASRFTGNLDVAAHGQPGSFPDFMGRYYTDKSQGHKAGVIPDNLEAAAELSALVFKHGYTDLTRPKYYEPINEPHWSFFGDEKNAQWHLKTHAAMKEHCPDVLVGGTCISVSYFQGSGYQSWKGMKGFMDATRGELDFYSFHSYDYYRSTDELAQNGSLVATGLPLEGSLDLINSYGHIAYGKPSVPLVISEHGGYFPPPKGATEKPPYDGEHVARAIIDAAPAHLRLDGFAGEEQKRSTVQWYHLSSIITNTLTFMDHPHSVLKSVPFLPASSDNWNAKYYAALLTPLDYERGGTQRPSFLMNFYKMMRDVSGRRIIADSPDSDLQVRAFASANTVYTVVNNLSAEPHTITLTGLPANATHTLRRLSSGADLIPSYSELPLPNANRLTLSGRDAIVLVSRSINPILEMTTLDERAFYPAQITQRIDRDTPKATFDIAVEHPTSATKAFVRIAFNRPAEAGAPSDYRLTIEVNGQPIAAPAEDAASRYTHAKQGYSTTRIVEIPTNLLRHDNKVTLSFPDGKSGTIGSVVIRTRG